MNNQLATALQPYVIGAIFGVIGLFASGFLKEFFDERARIATHKRNVARHVLKVCIEASTHNFLTAPRNMEDVYSLLTDLEGIDKGIETKMSDFINLWGRIIEIKNKEKYSEEDNKNYVEMMGQIEKDRKALVAWANAIRTGNDD